MILRLNDPEMVERIFDDVGNVDYIYQVIQESALMNVPKNNIDQQDIE